MRQPIPIVNGRRRFKNKSAPAVRIDSYRGVLKGKEWARQRLSCAIEAGLMQRPQECTRCHEKCTPDGHHDDYTKPLEVRWLCRTCHAAVHVEQRADVLARGRAA